MISMGLPTSGIIVYNDLEYMYNTIYRTVAFYTYFVSISVFVLFLRVTCLRMEINKRSTLMTSYLLTLSFLVPWCPLYLHHPHVSCRTSIGAGYVIHPGQSDRRNTMYTLSPPQLCSLEVYKGV